MCWKLMYFLTHVAKTFSWKKKSVTISALNYLLHSPAAQFREQKIAEIIFFLFHFSGGKSVFLKTFPEMYWSFFSYTAAAPYSALLPVHPWLVLEDTATIIFVGYKTRVNCRMILSRFENHPATLFFNI